MVNLSLLGVVKAANLTSLENRVEMELLADISHVHNTVAFQSFNTMTECSEIGGVVVKPTIGLLDHDRDLLLRDKNASGSRVFNGNTSSFEVLDERLEHRVVV